MSGLTFSSPTLSFTTPVLNGAATADVDATFTQVTPGAGTGTVDPSGNVVLRTSLRVDLHIDVANGGVVGDCTTEPVALELLSTAPYDPEAQTVMVRDANFSVPAFTARPGCEALIVGPLNDLLAGPGHQITMKLDGAMELPPEPGEATVTTLAVSPAGTAPQGRTVEFTSTVAPAPGAETPGPVEGVVEFLDGATLLGTAALADGTATFSTESLRVGDRQLVARYRGNADFGPSSSASLAYRITPNPTVTATLPDSLTYGAAPTEFTISSENPSSGSNLANVGVRVGVEPAATGGPRAAAVTLEQSDGAGAWTSVPLESVSATRRSGLIGPALGRPLAPGGVLSDQLRVAMSSGNQGQLKITLELVEIAPETGEIGATIDRTEGTVTVLAATRFASTLTLRTNPPVSPSVVRAGNVVTIAGFNLNTGQAPRDGTVTFTLDGRPVPGWAYGSMDNAAEPVLEIPIVGTGGWVPHIFIPGDTVPGSRVLTAQYSGNTYATPVSISSTITVAPSSGVIYDCITPTLGNTYRFRAQVRATGLAPAARLSGTTASLAGFQMELSLERSVRHGGMYEQVALEPTTVGGEVVPAFDLTFGGGGTGTAETVTRVGTYQRSATDLEPDLIYQLGGETASIPIVGDPGDQIPVTLDGFRFTLIQNGSNLTSTCTALDRPISFGSVTVAGTTLAVDAPVPMRADDPVTLTASVAPANATGTVAFTAGTELLDVVTVAEGTAATTVMLPEGSHDLKATFRAGASAPSSTSEVVPLTVLPAHECAAFTGEGSAAIVRLVFLELLHRCPDQAGFDYWARRLDSGTDPAVFARAIAYTNEAVDQVIIEAYRTVLDRSPSVADRTFWRNRFKAKGHNFPLLLAELSGSSEFFTKAGRTRAGLVQSVYLRLLGRAPSPGDVEYWADVLARSGNRGAVMLTLARLSEPTGRMVDRSYDEILGTAPAPAERSAAVRRLQQTGDRSDLYSTLIGDARFAARAATLPNPED